MENETDEILKDISRLPGVYRVDCGLSNLDICPILNIGIVYQTNVFSSELSSLTKMLTSGFFLGVDYTSLSVEIYLPKDKDRGFTVTAYEDNVNERCKTYSYYSSLEEVVLKEDFTFITRGFSFYVQKSYVNVGYAECNNQASKLTDGKLKELFEHIQAHWPGVLLSLERNFSITDKVEDLDYLMLTINLSSLASSYCIYRVIEYLFNETVESVALRCVLGEDRILTSRCTLRLPEKSADVKNIFSVIDY